MDRRVAVARLVLLVAVAALARKRRCQANNRRISRLHILRAMGAVNLRDNVWLELSGGRFTGTPSDTIGRLTDRDFAYARLKVYF